MTFQENVDNMGGISYNNVKMGSDYKIKGAFLRNSGNMLPRSPVWLGLILLVCRIGCVLTDDHIEVMKCPDSPIRMTNEPWRIHVPSYPFEGVNITLRQSAHSFPGCSSDIGMESISYFFTTKEIIMEMEEQFGPEETRTMLMQQVYMTPQGVLSYEHWMYQKDDFCLYNYTAPTRKGLPTLIFKICKFNCISSDDRKSKYPRNEPCIKKCCPLGMSVDFSSGYAYCQPTSSPVWKGNFYDKKTWKRMSTEAEGKLRPHYNYHILNCTSVQFWFGKPVTMNNSPMPKQSTRLLSDGNIIYISGARRWENLDIDFCFDGVQGTEGDNSSLSLVGRSSWPESDQVLILCATDAKSGKSRGQSLLYMCFLFGAGFFYLMTALVHGLLWEKQNSNGWSMFFLTLSMGCWSMFMGCAHALGLDGAATLRKSWVCMTNGIFAHFFMLAGFTWLTLINYSIFSTFRTLAPRNDGKNLKQLVYFVLIGFGGPLTIVLVGITLENLYPDKESLVLVPEYGDNICFVAEYAQGVYIYYILAALFLIIFVLSGLTCFKLHKFQKDTAKVRSASSAGDRSMALLYTKLSVVLGITWAFEFISWAFTNDGQSWFWAFPDLYNLFTSVIIFIIYACKASTVQQMETKFPCIKPVTQAVGQAFAAIRKKVSLQPEHGSSTATTSLSPNSTGHGGKMEMQSQNSIDKSLHD